MPASDDRYSAYNQKDQDGPGSMGYMALVCAWAVPGLGHVMLGEKARGFIFAVMIHLLFAGGLLIGGIRAINPPDQPIWTYTQWLTGWPMGVASYFWKYRYLPDYVAADPSTKTPIENEYDTESAARGINQFDYSPAGIAVRESFTKDFIAKHPLFSNHPKVQDMGSVYCGIAGMLNLLCMFDIFLRITGSVREDPATIKRRRAAAISPIAPAPNPGGGAA